MPKIGYKQTAEHKEKHLLKIRGVNNPNWKGGVKVNDVRGYYKSYFRTEDYKKIHRERQRTWRKNNQEKSSFYTRLHQFRVKNAIGKFTLEEWKELIKRFQNKCAGCKKETKLTIDHIIPISKGGTNYISNIQPLCLVCNSSKGSELELLGKAR